MQSLSSVLPVSESTSSSSSSCSESESSSRKDGRDSVMLNGSGAEWYDGKGAKETAVVVGCVKRAWVVVSWLPLGCC